VCSGRRTSYTLERIGADEQVGLDVSNVKDRLSRLGSMVPRMVAEIREGRRARAVAEAAGAEHNHI
jgi:hypothetical protein